MIINGLIANQIQNKKGPAPTDTFEEALLIEFGKSTEPYLASVLYGGLLEWLCLVEYDREYEHLLEYLKAYFKDTTIQTWSINVDEEEQFYSRDAVYEIGASLALESDVPMIKQKELLKNSAIADFGSFAFNQYCFPSIALITSRYYSYPVLPGFWRVKMK